MAILHAAPGQAINVTPFGAELINQKTIALFKSEQLEVMRLVLLTGKSLPPHKVPGEITIQCVEGKIEVSVEGVNHTLVAGQLLFLLGNVMHGVNALENSSCLVTIVLRK
jgi:quercetin dioxygenase-like cupin family protein